MLVEAVFARAGAGGGGVVNPPPNPPPSNNVPCRDVDGREGVCKDVNACTSGTPKRGLCPGAANIQCCLPNQQAPPVVVVAPPTTNCVQAKQGVNVRSSPSTSGSQIRLLAFGGERFEKSEEQNGWFHISNTRGSGWSYGT